MLTLQDIPNVYENIKNAPFNVIRILYELIFEHEADRRGRSKIYKFSGFTFEDNSDGQRDKLKFIDENFTINDLITIANILRLNFNTTKDELCKIICAKLTDLNSLVKQDEDEEEDDDDEDKEEEKNEDNDVSNIKEYDAVSVNSLRSSKLMTPAFSMNFRDVEDSIRKYDGTSSYPIEKWIADVDDLAVLLGWGELHVFIFAKKSLTGLAKLFIQSESKVNTWKSLKASLLKEFSSKVSSAQLHRMLAQRKMNKHETVQEYYLVMKELAARGSIETESLIQYIIDGITDETTNKIILFGATTLTEFKKKLSIYNEIKSKIHITNNFKNKSDFKVRNETRVDKVDFKQIRCYNCGLFGHKSMTCNSKSRGTKCFKCNQFGHIATNCGKKNQDVSPKQETMLVKNKNLKNNMHKGIKINGLEIMALIDTGSDVNLITNRKVACLNITKIDPMIMTLHGLASKKLETLGNFTTNIEIDNHVFLLTIHIVPDNSIPTDVILGKELINEAEVTINANGVQVAKYFKEENNIFAIQVDEEDDIADLPSDIKDMIKNYKPRSIKDTEVRTKIILSDEYPVYQHPRRLSIPEQREVDKQIQQWLEDGIIRHSSSNFASPIVLVKKKNGETRICVDYRKLNKKIIKDRYPLPLIEDQIDKLRGAKVFTSLDLKNGFFHVPVEETSIKYTAFVTPNGQYEFLKTPFGLCNSPAVFSRYVQFIFRDMIYEEILMVYMDDLIIPSKNEEEGKRKLQAVLERASEYNLNIKWKKCQFLQSKIEYLGYHIENNIISPSNLKTAAVIKYPKPTTVKQIQSFLGLTGYFRKFIPDYSRKAKPLSDLLKKNAKFTFGVEQEKAFEELKISLAQKPVLHIYSSENRTELHTDASKFGYGAILLQEDGEDKKLHPVYFFSRKTSLAEEKYTSYELEVLAIIEALKKFRIYLLGIHFKIVSDCAAFEMTMRKKELTTRVARWALLLEEFDYVIEHRRGDQMKHVDALSRNPIVMVIQNEFIKRIQAVQKDDEEIRTIKMLVEKTPYEDYLIEYQLLYKNFEGRNLLVIPKQMQHEVIKKAHDNGHFGVKKTEDLIHREFWIPKLKEKIATVIKNCIPCILSERKIGRQEGFLNSIDKGSTPLTTYHIDHLGPLVMTKKGYKHIFAVIDAFSKFVWLYAMKSTTTEEVIEKLEIQATNFGDPKRIIADRGTAFTSTTFQTYCNERQIQLVHITTGVPRGNGQIERVNRIIIPALTKLSIEDPQYWYKHLRKLQMFINNTYQRSIKQTPFELLIGVKMKCSQDIRIQEVIEEEIINSFEEEREELRREAKEQIMKVQKENMKGFNKKRKPPTNYKIGDLIAIKRTQFTPNSKILTKFLGPYQVVKVKGFDRYDVSRIGATEGPKQTSTSADKMKPWCLGQEFNDDVAGSSEADEIQEGRDVGQYDGPVTRARACHQKDQV